MTILTHPNRTDNPQPSTEDRLRLATQLDLVECMVEAERRKLREVLDQVWYHARFLWALWRDRLQEVR